MARAILASSPPALCQALRRELLERGIPRSGANGQEPQSSRMPGAHSRWSAGKDLGWEPLRIEHVCEVKYDHMQGNRFRHALFFLRWRPDRRPQDCRYDQLELTEPYELERIFSQGSRDS
jgi:ATP-dependent DNA ligase